MSRNYGHWQRNVTSLAGHDYTSYGRPGFAASEGMSQSARLLAEMVALDDCRNVVVSPCAEGVLAPFLRDTWPEARTRLMDTNCIAVEAARRTCVANGLTPDCVRAGLPEDLAPDDQLDALLVPMPKGRTLGRLYLLNALLKLRVGGRLFLSGGNSEGIKALVKDGKDLFGNSTLLGYKRGHRVVMFEKTGAPPPLPEPFQQGGIAPGSYCTYSIEHGGRALEIATRPGVFSWQHLDKGTELLLSVLNVRPDDRVLDLGCGAGVIGAVAATHATDGHTVLVDVDSLAVRCARETLRRSEIGNAQVVHGDGGDMEQKRFSLVVTNPPFHSGHDVHLDVPHAFIDQAARTLVAGGRMILVANRFLRYDRAMSGRFAQVDIIAANRSFHVIRGWL